MYVKIKVDLRTAEIAIGQHLVYSDVTVKRQNFAKIIRDYIRTYGKSSLDDHQQENEQNGIDKYAKFIAKSYFK